MADTEYHFTGSQLADYLDKARPAMVLTETERCAKICEDQRGSTRPIAAPLTNAAYDEACRDCAAAIRGTE